MSHGILKATPCACAVTKLEVLAIVAAADGLFDEGEQDRIVIHVFDRVPEIQLDEAILRHRLALHVPDVDAYENAMYRMSRFQSGDPVALLRSLRKLIDADGQVSVEETMFANEIQARLSARTDGASGF